ncbi:hypothetical protein LRS74_24420 [Streptomyces sp. LX-29]|uniref:hypothetical protein n=1 Tax=Streptomyces sp. LX-29 TaxID=2900152 RepID=UPI00240E13C3|nr:hypothetical protein [Streptomyces sp. LX-29]WFB09839.1 hypothetical protein LRS74_24420 [Streptomyces sp. LX-29]
MIGEVALALLGEESGAVIADTRGAVWYWLVRPGTAADWSLHRVLAQGAFVVVPGRERKGGPGLHWRVPPSGARSLTDPDRLHAALMAANRAVKCCYRCDRLTSDPVFVADVHVASGADRAVYACRSCAERLSERPDVLGEVAAGRRALEGRAR